MSKCELETILKSLKIQTQEKDECEEICNRLGKDLKEFLYPHIITKIEDELMEIYRKRGWL